MLNAVILGAGAMGCLYASYLCKNPNINLTLLDHRAAKVDEIIHWAGPLSATVRP